MSTPAFWLNNSSARWTAVPVPDDAKLYLPGLAFSSAMNSRKSLTGRVGETIMTGAKRVTIETGARSRIQSYGSLSVTAAWTMPGVE